MWSGSRCNLVFYYSNFFFLNHLIDFGKIWTFDKARNETILHFYHYLLLKPFFHDFFFFKKSLVCWIWVESFIWNRFFFVKYERQQKWCFKKTYNKHRANTWAVQDDEAHRDVHDYVHESFAMDDVQPVVVVPYFAWLPPNFHRNWHDDDLKQEQIPRYLIFFFPIYAGCLVSYWVF